MYQTKGAEIRDIFGSFIQEAVDFYRLSNISTIGRVAIQAPIATQILVCVTFWDEISYKPSYTGICAQIPTPPKTLTKKESEGWTIHDATKSYTEEESPIWNLQAYLEWVPKLKYGLKMGVLTIKDTYTPQYHINEQIKQVTSEPTANVWKVIPGSRLCDGAMIPPSTPRRPPTVRTKQVLTPPVLAI